MALGAVAAAMGCAGQGDIDRTQPDKVLKSIFFDSNGQPKIFYFRQTYVDVPPTSAWAFEGTQGTMDKVRFQIQEKFLVGYRAYDYAPGSENAFTSTANNMDTPLLVYAIESQFDVKREYNAGTGEQTNVISENTTDRPWDQRDYMRVDWSHNIADTSTAADEFDPTTQWMPILDVANPSYVQETVMSDPTFADRPIMTADYIDFVQHVTKTPDYAACANLYPGVDDGGPWDCGPAQIGVRNSLMPVKPSSYEPLNYPDNYPVLDTNGNQIELLPNGYPCTADTFQLAGGTYNGSDCSPATVGAFSKFGFFRTVVQTYNRNYGATQDGREYFANRWNIWDDVDLTGKSVFNADGTIRNVPITQRKPKPIVYYTNIEFPDDQALVAQAQQVAADWSDTLKQTIGALLASAAQPNSVISPSTVAALAAQQPEMVVLKQNSCNLTNVQSFLNAANNANIAQTVTTSIGLPVKSLDLAHLAQTCSIMEAMTASLADGDPNKFTWQRNGDLRYSFFYWVDRPEPAEPLGYGPASADPQTGEIISASLYNYGAGLDMYAQTSADAVELLNNQISVDDLLSGKTIADVLKETSQASAARAAQVLTPAAKAMVMSHLPPVDTTTGTARLIPIPGGQTASKMSLIKGTQVEQQMMTPDILAAMLPDTKPGQQLTADQFAQASPVTWLDPTALASKAQAAQSLSTNGCVFLGEFADDAVMGLAITLKQQGYSGQALWEKLRVMIFRGLADHEMGHTMGLRHNFSGSSDALNYADQFWNIHETMPSTQWDANSISEYRYSTVMDYGSRFNSDFRGLGKYDYAAIRFGYGQLVDVMPAGAGNETGAQLANDIFFDDYTKLPKLLNGVDNLQAGGVEPYDMVRAQAQTVYQANATSKNPQGGFLVSNERPYMFCSDEYIGNMYCKQWDYGANQQEIVDDSTDRFRNYFVFNAFKRGRLNWSINGYLDRLLQRYFIHYTEAYQFLFFYAPAYPGTDMVNDLMLASMNSLNALGEVLQTPQPGEHCPTKEFPNQLVLPDPTGANACLSGQPSTNIDIPDGKPYFINFSDDYYYYITRAGSLYEKLAALITLTSTQAHFYQVDTFADSNFYSINFYSTFKDQMLNLLSGVIRNDPTVYGGYVPSSGANAGTYQPTPVVDVTTFGQADPTLPDYLQPNVRRVESADNKTIQYYALGLALSNLDTSWDSTLDIANYLAVTLKGSKDDVTYAPGTQVIEFTHPQTGDTYRAPVIGGDTYSGIASRVIQELVDVTGQVGVPAALPPQYGADQNGNPLPDWQTAKAASDAAMAASVANTDTAKTAQLQTAYDNANAIFQFVDQQILAPRVDLLSDIRNFRAAFGY
ncbi:MAG TPA: zinc-dependent metalloprotease [Polyangia bacterium]|nr:zinc-dependent metalloprotease [Polyangia bacterium]